MKRHPLFSHIPLFLILFLGIYLRFDRLTTIPPSLSHDETAITYNAYSILTTGKDEYGTPYPLLFRSFDDYKLPGMVYATIPAVALFGLSETAARLPSAVFGVLSLLVMYGLAIELLGNRRWVALGKKKIDMALLPVLMLALSSWHINFSRQLFESNGAVFWFVLGTYFLLRSRNKYGNVVLAGLAYVAALYFYYSVRLVIPFVGLLYLVLHWKTITSRWKTTAAALVISTAVFLPLGREMISPGGLERISMVSVSNDAAYLKRRDAFIQNIAQNPTVLNRIVYNRRVALIATVAENYWKNISPHNLFVTGTGTYGALHPYEGLLIILGITTAFRLALFPRLLIVVWLSAAFLPGAFSTNQPNTLRTLIASPVFALLSGLGAIAILGFTAKRRRSPVLLFLIAAVLFTWGMHDMQKFRYAYFVDNPTNNALSFGDGYKQMVRYVKAHESGYDRVVVSGYYWRPYIFMLFWGNIPPADYQRSGSPQAFGNYVFTAASWDSSGIKLMDPLFNPETLPQGGNTLYILSKPEYEVQQKHFRVIDEIHGRHAQQVFFAAEEQ